jgi:hypothetical protein
MKERNEARDKAKAKLHFSKGSIEFHREDLMEKIDLGNQ